MSENGDLRIARRNRRLGSKQSLMSEIVTIGDDDYEIREPTWGKRDIILSKAGHNAAGDSQVLIGEMLIWATICCSYIPGTDELEFEEADAAIMRLKGVKSDGAFIETLGKAALRIMNVEAPKEEKNSEVTTGS